jgi:hypothetical protein
MFHHSIVVQETSITADGISTFELGVNPLSYLLVNVRPLNDTGTLTNYPHYLDVVGAINRLRVSWNGQDIINGSGRDLAALNFFRHGMLPMQQGDVETNDARRICILPILFGRFAYDSMSCFPASRRGELVLELDLDAADTGYNGLIISVDQCELLSAKPKEWERKVTHAQTFAATGQNDIELPLGNKCRGILAFGTTAWTGASPAPTLGRLETLVDNQQRGFSAIDFETAHTLPVLMGRQPPAADDHAHLVDATACDANERTSEGPIGVGSGGWQNYIYLDFDPTRDDEFSLDLKNAYRFQLRSNAEAAEAVRAISVERVAV